MAARPLTDAEIDECRWGAQQNRRDTRWAAMWALMEAGASLGELQQMVVEWVDLPNREVLLPGSDKTVDRIVPLNEWSVQQLARHLPTLPAGDYRHVVFGTKGTSSQLPALQYHLARIRRFAGLADDPAATTYSVRGWLGRKVWDESQRIEKVAKRLGLNSTDHAWEVIDIDWRSLP